MLCWPVSRLSTERYLQARAFISDRGRPLERLLFEHDFEQAPVWPVLDELATFQNDDGGFGHGLEPDSFTPASGALATSVALGVLAHVAAPAGLPLVRAAVDYLRGSVVGETRVWRIVPAAAADAPHAPWWSQDGLEERFGGYLLNPKADIVAQLLRLRGAAPRAWLGQLAADVVATVRDRVRASESEGGSGTLEMHDLIGVTRLLDAASFLDAPDIDASLTDELRDLVLPVAVAEVRAAAGAGGYGLSPMSLAPTPDSALAQALAGDVKARLDELVATQAEDGAWWPAWSWGEGSTAGEESRVAWAGVLTLEALRNLQAYGRIDRG